MIVGAINLLKYLMLSNIMPKHLFHDVDVALALPPYLNNHITPKMINGCILVYSVVSITSTPDYNFCTT